MAYIFITTKGKTNWKYILIIVILALIVIGETLYLLKQEEKIPEIKLPEKVVKDETLNWKTYRNEEYGFEIKYPKEFSVSEKNWNPEYIAWMVSLYPTGVDTLSPFNVPSVRINIADRTTFRVGTRNWQPFMIGEKELSIACEPPSSRPTFDCEIAGLFTDTYVYYIQTDKDPRIDAQTYQMLSTFRFLE